MKGFIVKKTVEFSLTVAARPVNPVLSGNLGLAAGNFLLTSGFDFPVSIFRFPFPA